MDYDEKVRGEAMLDFVIKEGDRRIAGLEQTLRDLHDNPIDLASRQSSRIAKLEGEVEGLKKFFAESASLTLLESKDQRIVELEAHADDVEDSSMQANNRIAELEVGLESALVEVAQRNTRIAELEGAMRRLLRKGRRCECNDAPETCDFCILKAKLGGK